MAATVSTSDPRSLKALDILQTADRWLRIRVAEGQHIYAVPSQSAPGAAYVTDTDTCTCPDFERRQEPCKHVLAVRLHIERLSQPAQRPTPPPREYTAEQLKAASALYDRLFPDEG